jgi:glycosyltransferase involved in cell wall biosynthesis
MKLTWKISYTRNMKSTATASPPSLDLSVIITAHAEGNLLHHTLLSVRRALAALQNRYSFEIIIHADNPTTPTINYLKVHEDTSLKDIRLFQNKFGDLGSSRNFAIDKAQGHFVATIDADDLMSENWLCAALDILQSREELTIAHSEITIEFEGADNLIIKHGEIDHETDALLSVYANRWNSVIIAPRQLLLEEPYAPNSPGYGYEDWHLNCRLINRHIHNILIPQTAIFVRRKKNNSEWLRQIQSMAVLRANSLLSFESIRSLQSNPFLKQLPERQIKSNKDIKTLTKKIIKKYPFSHKLALYTREALDRHKVTSLKAAHIPTWLQQEMKALHSIEKQIFPTTHLVNHIDIYDSLTDDHRIAGGLYKSIVDGFKHDSYDYLIFVPWLIKGGADRYAIDYANAIATADKDKHVLVVATLPVDSPWREKLDSGVDFLNFGILTQGTSSEIKYRLMEHIIENGGITHIHVINSEFGYEFIRLHHTYLLATGRKIIATAFSQSLDRQGRVFGYSHTHIPFVYDFTTLITSDNQAVIDMWQKEYGFDSNKLLLHHQPIPIVQPQPNPSPSRKPLRVLWAARVSFEKQPEIVSEVATLLKNEVIIDMYGTIEHGYKHVVDKLPQNVHYCGSFNGFESLPLEKYDVLLYTSLFDGMPNTILDAAHYGMPIVSAAVGGIPEFIIDGETGLLVYNPHNTEAYAAALRQFVDDIDLGKKLALNAYNKLEKDFSPMQYKEAIQTFLKKIEY